MAVTVEDGTIVDGANSYQSEDDLLAYLSLRGLSTEHTKTELTSFLIAAMDYIEAMADSFAGYRTSVDQSLEWPRADVYIDDILVGSDEIPRALVYAQLDLAAQASQGIDLMPSILPTDKGPVISEELSATGLKTAYASPEKQQNFSPAFAKADAHLARLRKRGGLSLIRG